MRDPGAKVARGLVSVRSSWSPPALGHGIVADDYDALENDVRAWCRVTGNDLVEVQKGKGHQIFFIEKAASTNAGKKLAMVISQDGLEELLSPLGFALGSALSGDDVYLYFQGPAVAVLGKGFKEKLHGLQSLFSGFARKELADIGHVPPQEKVRQLKELGAHLYACGPSMDHFGVKRTELAFEGITVAEYVTFMEIMRTADVNVLLQ